MAVSRLITGRSFLEGPRWHDSALYVSDMHGDAVLRVTEDGDVTTVVEVEQPSGLGWLPDGTLLISAMTRRCVMRYDGSKLAVHADVGGVAPGSPVTTGAARVRRCPPRSCGSIPTGPRMRSLPTSNSPTAW